MTDRITVSMPMWHATNTIRRSVESVLNQTHHDLTLIVVNDGGPPDVWTPLEDIGDPRLIRFDLTPNRGRYQADAITLAAFQQHIRDRYYKTDSARGTPATFMWLVEEVGELATALNAAHTQDRRDQANIEEEFADVIAWLCTLANINGVDLEAAVRAKYLTGPGPTGHK